MPIVATASNIRGNPIQPLAAVRARITQAARHPGINLGAELDPGNVTGGHRYSQLWADIMAAHGKRTFGSSHEVPVSIPREHWDVVTSDVVKVHGGLAHVSPARYFTVVRAIRSTGQHVAFIACHPVSKPRYGVKRARWRMDHHTLYCHRLAAQVADLHDDGWTVVFGGDLNMRRVRLPRFHPDQRRLISSGLDHLFVVPAPGLEVVHVRSSKQRRTRRMDHPIITASFDLRKAA